MRRLDLSVAFGWGFPSWNEREVAAFLAETGLDRVQLFRSAERDVRPAEARGLLAEYGLAITSLHARFGPGIDPSVPDEAARWAAMEMFEAEALFARELGADLIVVHPGCEQLGDAATDPRRIEALERSAEALAEIAERRGVTFAIENMPPGMVGTDMAMLRRVVDHIDSPRLGLNYDCGHAHMSGDAVGVLEAGGSRIIAIHLHDNAGDEDSHVVPGYGTIDFDAVCRGLARVGYGGEFCLELMESLESVRDRCDAEWWGRLSRWIDLASGVEQGG